LHAFDSVFVEGMKIVVRAAEDGETIRTLDGMERKLSSEDLLICDCSKPIAIAGIMGGENSQVNDDTKSIILECAYFNPISVRKTSKKLKLSTESSYRFERGVDPNAIQNVIDRTCFLLYKHADAKIEKTVVDIYPEIQKPSTLLLNMKKLNSTLGTNIRKNKVDNILGSLGIEKITGRGKEHTYKIPTFRVDIGRDIDLIEEIARIYGYNSIPHKLPSISLQKDIHLGSRYHKVAELKQFISSIGFSEAINYSFIDPNLIKIFDSDKITVLINPISSDQSEMRTTLLPGLIQNMRRNINYQQGNLKLFEIGKVYNLEDGNKNVEFNKLAMTSSIERVNNLWDKRLYDFFDLKGEVINILNYLRIKDGITFDVVSNDTLLHPGNSSSILINDINVGLFGELHPDIKSELDISSDMYIADLSLDLILDISSECKMSFTQVPRHPYLKRDLSLVVDNNVSASEIVGRIYDLNNDNIKNVEITDVYSDHTLTESGKKSLTVSITLMSDEKTLTDEEANFVQSKTLDKLTRIFNAQLRS
jgi:phenylalanyl-tRNA synthetase beta chain